MEAPKIDKRSYQEIVAETEALAQSLTGWQPQPENQLDVGGTLIRIFGRFAELIIERLNQVPDKAFLAFLDLIGTEIYPPKPARVPLTFQLATNSPVDAFVPAGTQTAAPPAEGEEQEIIFETEQDLLVTRAQLMELFVRDFSPQLDHDRYGRYTPQALGQIDEPFPIFVGNRDMPHNLYLACDALLNLEAPTDITVHFIGAADTDVQQLSALPLVWAYLQGETWQEIATNAVESRPVTGDTWDVVLKQLPPVEAGMVNGVKGGWLRLQLQMPLPPATADIPLEAMAIGAANPITFQPPFYPFGADGGATYFYLNGEAAFARRGATVTLEVALATPGISGNIQLQWDYLQTLPGGNTTWRRLGAGMVEDGTAGWTRNGRIRLRIPADGSWNRGLYRNWSGRWLRVSVAGGAYTQAPQIQSLTAASDWELPRLNNIDIRLPAQRPERLAQLGFTNSLTLDMSKDFYPFGEEPRFNDTFYLAYGSILEAGGVKPGDLAILNVTLTTPGVAGGTGDHPEAADSVEVVWEFWNGRLWQRLGGASDTNASVAPTDYNFLDNTYAFTRQPATGGIQFNLPAEAALNLVNGEENYWLRVRLIRGDYGARAAYQAYTITLDGNAITAYRLVAANYRPPLIASLRFNLSNTTRFDLTACQSYNDFQFVDHTSANAASNITFVPFTPTTDQQPALYLGFDRPFDNRSVTLYAQVEPPQPDEVIPAVFEAAMAQNPPQVSWEYSSPQGWDRLGAIDETNAFDGRGLIRFIGPKSFTPRPLFGYSLYWLRVRWTAGEFPIAPRLRRLLTNTTWAGQAVTIQNEILGSSDGNPNQSFQLAQQSILTGQRIEVREADMPSAEEQETLKARWGEKAITTTYDTAGNVDEIWISWQESLDFHGSGPRDRHYILDRTTGNIRFGDGQHGLIPPVGQNNIRAGQYRSGGGLRGNRPAQTIVQLKSSVPYIDSVINYEEAAGGAERQSLDSVKRYGPRQLRHSHRAITTTDVEDLAFAASTNVARAKAIPPTFNPLNLWLSPGATPDLTLHQEVTDAGTMGLIIVPYSSSPRPIPSLELLKQVKNYLLERCAATADLWVAGPEWIEVKVNVTVVPESLTAADFIGEAVTAALERFLHPLTGGLESKGWAFGRKPYRSDLYALVESVTGVDHVRTLSITESPDSGTVARLERHLIYSGRHEVIVAL